MTNTEEVLIERRQADGCDACRCGDRRFVVLSVQHTGEPDGGWIFEVACARCLELEDIAEQARIDREWLLSSAGLPVPRRS